MAISIYHPPEGDESLDTQWDYLTRVFGIPTESVLLSVDQVGQRPVVLVQSRDGVLITGDTDLTDFQHPEDVCYFFGASNGIIKPSDLSWLNVLARVYIPSVPTWELYAPQAAAIVLWDRKMKARG